MFVLTDEAIEAGINTISGFIAAKAAEVLGLPVAAVAELFYASEAYAQLADPATGRYWDSLPELLELFLAEARGADAA